jgi:hypothetical protein
MCIVTKFEIQTRSAKIMNEFESQILWQCTSTNALLVCIVSIFLKTPKYGFAKGFHDYTENVVCTECFAI